MKTDYIFFAIPAFFILIGVELLVSFIKKQKNYRFSDAINNLSCGMIQQVTGVFYLLTTFSVYVYVHAHFAVFSISFDNLFAWVICFFGVDFTYYWFHRLSHEVGFLWGGHAAHHQSEDYNLAVALRQGSFQPLFSWAFYLPLAVLGFPPVMYLTLSQFNTLYQFWVHTRTVDRLGPLEWVLSTPSHHRVHHGRNAKYLDRNHGGIFIVWDRLFGTFQVEEEEPVYGTVEPLNSWNPVWANFDYYAHLWRASGRMSNFGDALRVWWKEPGWRGTGVAKEPIPEFDAATVRKFDPPAGWGVKVYVFFSYVLVSLAGVVFVRDFSELSLVLRVGCAGLIVFSLVALGNLLEGRRMAVWVEGFRFLVFGVFVLFFFGFF